MQFSVISSGSKANCTFIDTGRERILIDIGLSAKKTEERLANLYIDPKTISAIFVTHEHSDHILGVPAFSKRWKVPIYTTYETSKQFGKGYAFEQVDPGVDFWVGSTRIRPFSVPHDAVNPVAYSLMSAGLKFTQVTDLGRVTPVVLDAVRDSNALVLESNHCPEMLMNCSYTWDLKKRISSHHGHISNEAATALLSEINHSGLCHVVLAHISENSNTPERALEVVENHFRHRRGFSLLCGNVYRESSLMRVGQVERIQVSQFN